MMTWKEPFVVRQHNKNFPRHFPPNLLRRKTYQFLFVSFLTPLMTASFFNFHIANRTQQQQFASLTLIFLGVALIGFILSVGIPILTRQLEATYRLDDKGITTRRAGFSSIMDWNSIKSLEIVPHPAIENISLLKVALLEVFTMRIEEIPFEREQIDSASVMELYEKNRPKK